jgi:conflict system pore-forming effector with SLATT domain
MSGPASYKEDRLQKQIEWHSERARDNKIRFRMYQIITLVASAIIPIINIANIGDFQTRMISSIIAGIIAPRKLDIV